MRKFGAVVLAVLILAGFAYYMLILQVSDVDETLYSIDLDEVRTLAGSVEGALPVSINTEAPTQVEFPAAAVVTGWNWSAHAMPIYAYQVMYPNGHVMIDSAMSQAQVDANGAGAPFDAVSYARMEAALGSAQQIVFTHEHFDHVGGAIAHPRSKELLAQVRLTERQVSDFEYWGGITYPEGALDGYEPLGYDRLHVLAPGIVLIEAAGHTPGSQIIYVRLQNGQEYLFIGDVAWNYAGINLVRPRPNLVSRFFLGEDRPRTHAQVAALKALEAANPGLAIVVGHDGSRTDAQIASGLLNNRFQ